MAFIEVAYNLQSKWCIGVVCAQLKLKFLATMFFCQKNFNSHATEMPGEPQERFYLLYFARKKKNTSTVWNTFDQR